MPRSTVTSLVLIVVALATTVSAQDIQFASNVKLASMLNDYDARLVALEKAPMYDGKTKSGTDCRPSGLTFQAEAALFRYYRADGFRTNTAPGAELSNAMQASPRLTLGYSAPNGMGIRARWWQYAQLQVGNAQDVADYIDVDTYNFDVELYHSVPLSSILDMEVSGGVRYNNFREALHDVGDGPDRLHLNEFDGIGLLGAIEFRGDIYRHGSLFGRARLAGICGDKYAVDDITDPTRQNDTIQGMVELTLGYRYSRTLRNNAVLYGEIAGEVQHWQNFSSSFEDTNSGDDFGGPADVGFAGVLLSVGIRR